MRLDLPQEFADIYGHIADRVKNFDPAGSDVLGEPSPVKSIEVGYGQHWFEASEAREAEPITLVQLDGTETPLAKGTEIADILGEVIKAALLKARAAGVFASLPKAPGCEMGVEHFDGGFGWPIYEERGMDNLVEP